jgi:Na+/phosphate symporter
MDHIEKLHDKVDDIQKNISEINVTLAKQAVSLEEHIRRTKNLEDRVEPIETHVKGVAGIIKFFSILATIATIAEVLSVFFRHK